MKTTLRKLLSAAILAIAASTASATDAQWTAAPLTASSASIRTDGTFKYAYARGDYSVNGVEFGNEGTDGISNSDCVVNITHDALATPPDDIEAGGYASLLSHGWYASAGDRTITLNNLEAGKKYLVQLIAFRADGSYPSASATAPDGETFIKFGGEGWKYGGSLTGEFTADGTTATFTVSYAVNAWLNGIQVRDLGAGGGGADETPVYTLTIPAKTGLVLDSVATNGVAVATASGNAYSIVSNDTATITFSAASGYEIVSGNPVVLTVTADKTLADAEYPVVQQTGGGATVVEPSIGAASVATSGATATITLSDVAMGTDANGVAATSYCVSNSLDGAAAVLAVAGANAATVSFDVDISGLADGAHTCEVTIATDAGKTASKSVSFTIGSTPPPPDAVWTAEAMDAAGLKFSTEGDLVYAYALQPDVVNTISFSAANPIMPSHGIAFNPNYTGSDGNLMNEGVADLAYGYMLGNGWCWEDASTTTQAVTLVLKRLAPGHKYLVQILSHTMWSDHLVVSANGCAPQHVHGADEASGKYGALITGVFTASAETQDVEITFAGSTGKRPINAVQVRDLGEVFRPVVAPAIGSLSAATSGSTATIVLGGVETGTDAYGTNATSYAVSYRLDGGAAVEKLWNQTGWSAWFNVTNLSDGPHTVEATILTDMGGEASKSVSFTIDSSATTATTAWIVEPMSMNGDTIRTDGDLLYAHAPNDATVHGVAFKRTPYIKDANFSVSPVEADPLWGGMLNEGLDPYSGYAYLLGHAWYWDRTVSNVAVEVTLTGLTPGNNYLVPIVSHSQWTRDMLISVNGTDPQPVGTKTPAEVQGYYIPYRYGASVVGLFTAAEATQTFTIEWTGATGEHPLNALQVRDLGVAVPVVVEPSIGAVSAAKDLSTAVVTLSGVVKGTDDECNPASFYDVSYVLTRNGEEVSSEDPVLEDRTGSTAAFPLANLVDGDYECKVTITTDAGKSASKSVSFTIGSTPFEWKTVPTEPDGSTICTNGARVWAYCRGPNGGQVTANGVSFTSYETLTNLPPTVELPFSISANLDRDADDWGDEGLSDGLGKILDNAFYADSDGTRTFKLEGLAPGHSYLVQLIMHKSGSGAKAYAPLDVADYVQFGDAGGADADWTYGGSLIGTFLAESADYTFTVKYDGGFAALNAIQLRDLGVTVPTEADPSIGSVSAKRKGTAATVTLAGVEMGTDQNRHPATSYDVSCSFDEGATWTTVLTGQNGETATFVLTGLEYETYVCDVRITTDAGKTASKRVTLAFTKADGLAIVYFDVEAAALAFDMGSAEAMAAKLPVDEPIYCTLVTSTNLAEVVWTPAQPSRNWKENLYPAGDDKGWTWCDGLDTSAAVRFFRIAVTPMKLAEDEEVVFK